MQSRRRWIARWVIFNEMTQDVFQKGGAVQIAIAPRFGDVVTNHAFDSHLAVRSLHQVGPQFGCKRSGTMFVGCERGDLVLAQIR